MLRNYLLTALRNVTRHRLYSFINIAGLAIGLACAIFIIIFLRDEMSYDGWIPGGRNVWRVDAMLDFPGIPAERAAVTPFPLGSAMHSSIPEVRSFARDVPEEVTIRAGARQFPETVEFVDPNFFDVIQLPLDKGSRAHLLAAPTSIVLTHRAARKYFGNSDAVGQTFTVEGKFALTVSGILHDPPHNSSFQNDFYISNRSGADSFEDKEQWLSTEVFTYVRLLPGASIGDVVRKTQAILRRNADPSKFIKTNLTGDQLIRTRLVPLADIHLSGDEIGGHQAGSWTVVYGFAVIALLILAIACFNFTNLATARATMRTREVSLRKVVGARRLQLVAQFIGESVLTALLALLLAFAIVEVLLPSFESFLDRRVALTYFADSLLPLGLIVTAILAGVASGFYPAILLSGSRPTAVLHSGQTLQGGRGLLRTGLVVLQFAISIGLGIAAIVVFAQIGYARHLDLGFDRDNVVVIDRADALTHASQDSLTHRLLRSPDIVGVAQSSAVPFGGLVQGTSVSRSGDARQLTMRILTAAPEFFRVYDMRLLAGRFLSKDRGTDVMSKNLNSDQVDSGRNIVIDAAAARNLGLTPPQAIGRIVNVGSTHAAVRIVGVVADARFFRSRGTADPTIFVNRPTFIYTLSVRVRAGHIPRALALIDHTWREFAPTVAIRRYFLDDSFDKLFAADEQQGEMFGIFVGIAIFIACLGLFGLAAFSAERRTKEIGLRKIFGARTGNVVRLLLWQFSIPVLIANVIAWPVAWYYLHSWLEGYAYRIALSPVYFLAAGAATLVIAWVTVIGHSLAVARANPVHALRYE